MNEVVIQDKEIEQDLVGKIVMPGQIVGSVNDLKVRLGPGLLQNQQHIIATKSGILRKPEAKYYWIENVQKRVVFLQP